MVFIGAIFTVTGLLNDPSLFIYFGVLGIPFSWFMWKIYCADRKEQFTQLSALAKVLMLVGTLSMAFL